jgi:hypothetical protein
MARRRLVQRAVNDVVAAARRRRRRLDARQGSGPTADELARRLDETRARLRRDIPPRSD